MSYNIYSTVVYHNISTARFTKHPVCMYVQGIVFSLKCCNFSAAVLVFDLPLCTHTDTEGKPREARVRNILENIIFNEHPVVQAY